MIPIIQYYYSNEFIRLCDDDPTVLPGAVAKSAKFDFEIQAKGRVLILVGIMYTYKSI